MHKQEMNQAMHDASRVVQECEAVCIETVQYCLKQGGPHVESSHMVLMMECIEICATTVKFFLLGSFHAQVGGVCADVCEACAASCEQFGGDAQMKACAEMCRKCAAVCRQAPSA